MATDITMHSDSELADMFDNDEGLYGIACAATDFDELEAVAREVFVFTHDQLAELKTDFQINERWG